MLERLDGEIKAIRDATEASVLSYASEEVNLWWDDLETRRQRILSSTASLKEQLQGRGEIRDLKGVLDFNASASLKNGHKSAPQLTEEQSNPKRSTSAKATSTLLLSVGTEPTPKQKEQPRQILQRSAEGKGSFPRDLQQWHYPARILPRPLSHAQETRGGEKLGVQTSNHNPPRQADRNKYIKYSKEQLDNNETSGQIFNRYRSGSREISLHLPRSEARTKFTDRELIEAHGRLSQVLERNPSLAELGSPLKVTGEAVRRRLERLASKGIELATRGMGWNRSFRREEIVSAHQLLQKKLQRNPTIRELAKVVTLSESTVRRHRQLLTQKGTVLNVSRKEHEITNQRPQTVLAQERRDMLLEILNTASQRLNVKQLLTEARKIEGYGDLEEVTIWNDRRLDRRLANHRRLVVKTYKRRVPKDHSESAERAEVRHSKGKERVVEADVFSVITRMQSRLIPRPSLRGPKGRSISDSRDCFGIAWVAASQ